MFIDISKIDASSRTQLRCRISEDTVDLYAEDLRNGINYPPVVLFPEDDTYYVGDGYHRIEAAKAANRSVVEAKMRPGGLKAALEYAAGANDKHGLRRTQNDKRKAIQVLLKDPEYCKKSDREIAKIVNVVHGTVGSVREELESSGQISQMKKREVFRKGETYLMDVKKDDNNDSADPARDKEGDNEILSPDELPLYDLVFAELDTIQKSKNIFRNLGTRIVKGGFLLVAAEQSDVPALFKMVDKSLTYFWMFSLPCNREIDKGKAKIASQWKPVLVWYKGNPGSRQFTDFIFSNGNHIHLDHKKFYQMLLADFTAEGDRLGIITSEDHSIFKFGDDFKCQVEPIQFKNIVA